MTQPRNIQPARYWFISRRCTQRTFLLRPSATTDAVFRYCLAASAKRHGIEVVAYCVMSNHYHAVVRDTRAALPAFLRDFHRDIAKALNRHWRRRENFWASGATSALPCDTPESLLASISYTLTNPVQAQLVDKVVNWPGANSYRAQLQERPRTLKRPKLYFSEVGDMPAKATLTLARPEPFEQLSTVEWRALLQTRVRAAEGEAARARASSGRRVLGRKAVLRQSHRMRPRRRGRGARVHRRGWPNAKQSPRDREFVVAYAKARRRHRAGDVTVVFPAGTYQLRVEALVRCAPFRRR